MAKDLADPSSSINKDGTVKEHGEGTLDKCIKCKSETFISFESGFLCTSCRVKNIMPRIDDVVERVFNERN